MAISHSVLTKESADIKNENYYYYYYSRNKHVQIAKHIQTQIVNLKTILWLAT